MPRKKTSAATAQSADSLKMANGILTFFRTADLAVALFAAALVNQTIAERQNKGKAVVAGRAKVAAGASTATAAADAATASIGGVPGQAVPAKKKPGPPKGRKKARTNGSGAQAGDGAATANDAPGEVTGSDLPPQTGAAEGSLDLG